MASLLDRVLRPLKPSADASFAPPPRELAPGLWVVERRMRMPGGLVLPVSSPVFRLPSGALLVVSPPRLDPSLVASIGGLGRVAALLAPNSFHHLFVADSVRAFPDARVFLAPGLAERIPGLPPGTAVGAAPPPEWEDAFETIVFGPAGGFAEVVLFHRATRTLVLTDLAFHMTSFQGTRDRVGWRLFGVPPWFGPSRTARWTLLADARVAAPALRRIAEWPFERILVAHGDPLERDARAEFARAYARWLAA